MAQSPSQGSGGLEDQLRNMILGNVTMSGGQPSNRGRQARPHPRGRSHPNSSVQHGAPSTQASNGHVESAPVYGSSSHSGSAKHVGPLAQGVTSSSSDQRSQPNPRGSYRGRSRYGHQQGTPRPHSQSNQPAHPRSEPIIPNANAFHDSQRARGHHWNRQHGRGSAGDNHQQPSAKDFAGVGATLQAPRILKRTQNPQQPPNGTPMPPVPQSRPYVPPSHYEQHNQWSQQARYLDFVAQQEIPQVEITPTELDEKEAFRSQLESICKDAMAEGYTGDISSISLVGFGSLSSGFATKGSDMDLAIVPHREGSAELSAHIDKEIPRLLEKAVLGKGLGGRLLTRTRVPILKVCEKPTEELFKALSEEREKWDDLPEEEKYASPAPPQEPTPVPKALVEVDGQATPTTVVQDSGVDGPIWNTDVGASSDEPRMNREGVQEPPSSAAPSNASQNMDGKGDRKDANARDPKQHPEKPWLREKILGPLDFPKSGVGIQCDINFSNILALHNTHLLRCYSLCDPRVRPMVIFVKAWAKRRKINSSYSGTLSSYGYVLMVLHYLVNIAQPPVCPNLQLCWKAPTTAAELEKVMMETTIDGYSVRFWRNEAEIVETAKAGRLTRNAQSLGSLLREFFMYYASPSLGYIYGPRPPSFFWTSQVLSLRTPQGILSKEQKGWTGAKTTNVNGKEIRHRFLFAIEDPFETDHNVARTVTHHGIVTIRDEFRRAWRILQRAGLGQRPEGGLFDEVLEVVTMNNEAEKKVHDKISGDTKDEVTVAEEADPAVPASHETEAKIS